MVPIDVSPYMIVQAYINFNQSHLNSVPGRRSSNAKIAFDKKGTKTNYTPFLSVADTLPP